MKKKIFYGISIILLVFVLIVNIIFSEYFASFIRTYINFNVAIQDLQVQIAYLVIALISVVVLLCVIAFMTRALILECLPALRERIEAKKRQKLVKAEQDKAKRIERLEKELDELKKDK